MPKSGRQTTSNKQHQTTEMRFKQVSFVQWWQHGSVSHLTHISETNSYFVLFKHTVAFPFLLLWKIQLTLCYCILKTAKSITKKAQKLKMKQLSHVFMENNCGHSLCSKFGKIQQTFWQFRSQPTTVAVSISRRCGKRLESYESQWAEIFFPPSLSF